MFGNAPRAKLIRAQPRHDFGQESAFDGLDALGQRSDVVAGEYRHGLGGDYRAGVDSFIHVVDSRGSLCDSCCKYILNRMCAGKSGSGAAWVLTIRPA